MDPPTKEKFVYKQCDRCGKDIYKDDMLTIINVFDVKATDAIGYRLEYTICSICKSGFNEWIFSPHKKHTF